MTTNTPLSVATPTQRVDKELGVSRWVTIDQQRIDRFAQCIGDHRWVHVDVERARLGKDRCVVTVETASPKKQRQNRKIPDACKTMGQVWCNPFEFNRALPHPVEARHRQVRASGRTERFPRPA
jgi:acyl dehydratase